MSRHGSHYGFLFPEFFTGETGRRIAREGGANAQVLGAYLTANRSATMIGMYNAPMAVIQSDIHSLSTDQIAQAFGVLQEADFARYDEPTEMVWVLEMARIRLGLKPKQEISQNDNRVGTVQQLYERCLPNPFLSPFFTKYGKVLRLERRRRYEGAWKPPLMSLARPRVAPISPVSGTVSVSGTGIRDQKEHQEDQDPALRLSDLNAHLLRAGHDYIEANPECSEHDLGKELQTVAGQCGVPQREYTTAAIQPFVDQLIATRKRRGQKVPA